MPPRSQYPGERLVLSPLHDASDARPSRPGGIKNQVRNLLSFPVFVGAMVSVAAVSAASLWDRGPAIGAKALLEGDTWWHLAVGQRILSTHTFPTVDIYSFTMHGAPWIAYEWLGDVAMAVAARAAGLQGLAVLLILLAILLSVLIYYYAWLRSRNVLASGIAAIAVLQVAKPLLGMRPQMLGFVFLTLTLMGLELFRQGRRKALWPLPFIFLVWVNTHGSFVLGFFALGTYLVCGLVRFRAGSLEARRWAPRERLHLLWISFLCLGASLLTPYGARLFVYPMEMLSLQKLNLSISTEFQPLQFSTGYGQVFLLIVLICLAMQVAVPLTYRLETLALLLFAIGETLLHARFLIFFAILVAPVLAAILARWLPGYRREQDHPLVNAGLVGATALGIILLFPSMLRLHAMVMSAYPVGAVHYLDRIPGLGNQFNREEMGGFLIWAMPERKVFIDGRNDLYEYGGVLWDYYNFVSFRSRPSEFFGKYNIQSALLRRDDVLVGLLQTLPGWSPAYCDANSVVFVRSEPGQTLARDMAGAQTSCP